MVRADSHWVVVALDATFDHRAVQHGRRDEGELGGSQSIASGSVQAQRTRDLRAEHRRHVAELDVYLGGLCTPIRITPPSALEKATAVFCNCSIDVPRLNSTCSLSPGNAARNSGRLMVRGAAARESG